MPARDRVRRHVWVTGRVQNVWFRDACRREALERGVDGWVRNLPDHRVEAVFEGSPAPVDALVAWCHEGPSRARVTKVETREELPTNETGFIIL
jgi:acylphosphatase